MTATRGTGDGHTSVALPLIASAVWLPLGAVSIPVLIMTVMSLAAAQTDTERLVGTILYAIAWSFPLLCAVSGLGGWGLWLVSRRWDAGRHKRRRRLWFVLGLLPLCTFALLIVAGLVTFVVWSVTADAG